MQLEDPIFSKFPLTTMADWDLLNEKCKGPFKSQLIQYFESFKRLKPQKLAVTPIRRIIDENLMKHISLKSLNASTVVHILTGKFYGSLDYSL